MSSSISEPPTLTTGDEDWSMVSLESPVLKVMVEEERCQEVVHLSPE